uniref:hypothetical protein n=1 Tax=Thaumasiovibrio occultus TaxID=1891184 RepID=UPI000B351D40|nr:hypothetical protein [Thaumasiovibrio occultus]
MQAKRVGTKRAYGMKGNAVIVPNAAVFLAAGLAVAHAAATPADTFVGVATLGADATGQADGVERIEVDTTEIKFANAGDVTAAHIGATAYFASASTLSADSATNTRTPAGVITQVDDDGVWTKTGV